MTVTPEFDNEQWPRRADEPRHEAQDNVIIDEEIRLADPFCPPNAPSGHQQRCGSNKPSRQQAAPQRQQQAVKQASWPADPFSLPTAPLSSAPATAGWQGKQTWRDDDQRREMRERRAALRRQEADLQSHLQRLEAQECALAAHLAALPSSPSPLRRILIALVLIALVVSGIVVLLHWFPLLLVLVIFVVGLAAKAARRAAPVSRQHTVWLRQERNRLESRRRGIIAEQCVIRQHLTALQSELHQMP